MPDSSSTSFIPKRNPAQNEKRAGRRKVYIGTFIVRTLFFAALVGTVSVYAYEQKPLTHQDGSDLIVNTNCDAGCNYITAAPWVTPTNYGFGFNMSGEDIASDFANSTYFRPFADNSNGQNMSAVMSSSDLAIDQLSTVTYKVSIGGSQAAGIYNLSLIHI